MVWNPRYNIVSFFWGVTSIIFGHQTHFTIQWTAIIFRIFYFELTSKDSQSLNIENKFILFRMASALHIIYDRTTQDYFVYLIQFFCNRARELSKVKFKRCPWISSSANERFWDEVPVNDNECPRKSPKKERDSIHLPEISIIKSHIVEKNKVHI